jgi:hypothetical protein
MSELEIRLESQEQYSRRTSSVWQKADYYLTLSWFGPPNDMTSSNVINGQVHTRQVITNI